MENFKGKKCKYCNKPLRARQKSYKDWATRQYHVKCYKEYCIDLEILLEDYERKKRKKLLEK